ncbi:MBL fold hydrolase [Lysinibacillus sp. PLM2]|nr:MBL fold hydrolase [Lysinibacillus sp. PLM2]
MKIIPLGVGGAFTKTSYHNNYIIQLDEKCILIDAGTTLRYSLLEAGFHYRDIDFIFISHLHFDHVGGLEELVLQRFWHFEGGEHIPQKTTVIIHEKLLDSLKTLLSNGLENQGKTVDDFCEFICLNDSDNYKIGDYVFSTFDTSNTHAVGMLSFGFKLAREDLNIVFSSDVKRLEDANLLKQIDDNTTAIFQDVSFTFNGAHSTLQEVLDYYPENLHRNIYAMHYNDNVENFLDAIERSHIQLVKKQKIIEF